MESDLYLTLITVPPFFIGYFLIWLFLPKPQQEYAMFSLFGFWISYVLILKVLYLEERLENVEGRSKN